MTCEPGRSAAPCPGWLGVRRAGLKQSPALTPGHRRSAAEPLLIAAAEVSSWVGSLVARGLAPSTATRALATLRSVLAFAVADGPGASQRGGGGSQAD
jgi:hypothetical protein